MEYKEITVQQKLEIRREFEKFDFSTLGKFIIPTDLAVKVLQYCFNVSLEQFIKMGEAEITRLCSEAFNKLFFEPETQKKS